MQLTSTVPNVPLEAFKRTKIIATVGPSTHSYEAILALIEAGANGLRLNFSHGTNEERDQQIQWIRKASECYGKPVAIIQDLQGPKIRLGDFDDKIEVKTGQVLTFQYQAEYPKSGHIPTQYDLSKKVTAGERLYLFDGKVRTTIVGVEGEVVHARADNDGYLVKRKGMNLPDTDFSGDILTKKDEADIEYGATRDIDYVSLSFIQTAEDVENLRTRLRGLGSDARVIGKIETKAAVENIESIVWAADAVMIARGDLAVETELESVPIVQRQIVELGIRFAKPTIVATQMLLSMTSAPEPTRAEVSDVATAVLMGADCVMLSDETASGEYPIEAVKVMKKVVRYAEQNAIVSRLSNTEHEDSLHAAIGEAVINLANNIHAKAIIAETSSGMTALQISAQRSDIPLIAVTSNVRTAQQLAIAYDIKSYVRPVDALAAFKLGDWLLENEVFEAGDIVVTVSGRQPGLIGATDTIRVRRLGLS